MTHVIPNLFIPGTPKGATTSLADWVSQHSQIQLARLKEPWFFNDDRSTGHFVGREKAYLDLFEKQEGVRYYCDASPDYLFSKNALGAIADYSPDARYLVTFRPYADAFFSLHQQERFMNLEPIESAEEAFQACNQRRRDAKRSRRVEISSLFYDERLRVGSQLVRALEFIPREHIMFIDFRLFRTSPETIWRGIEDFLGLPHEDIEFTVKNPRKTVTTGPAATLLRHGKTIKNMLGIRGKSRFLADAIRARVSPPDTDPPALSEEFRAQVDHRFRFDRALVERFAKAGPAVLADGFYQCEDLGLLGS